MSDPNVNIKFSGDTSGAVAANNRLLASIKSSETAVVSLKNSLQSAVAAASKIGGSRTIQQNIKVNGIQDIEKANKALRQLEGKTISAAMSITGIKDIQQIKSLLASIRAKDITQAIKLTGIQDVNKAKAAIAAIDKKQIELGIKVLGLKDVASAKTAIESLYSYSNKQITAKLKVDGLAQASDGVKSLSGSMSAMVGQAAALTGLTLGFAAVGNEARKTVMAVADLDYAMSAVAAVGGLDKASEEFKNLTKVAVDMGAATRFTSTEAAEGLKELIAAGYNTADAVKVLGDTLNLASTEDMSLAAASGIVVAGMQAMGLGVSEATRYTDVLARAANASTASITDMGESLKYAAPVANQLGIPLEQISAAIAILANNGVRGGMAGRGLNSVLAKLVAPTKDATDALKEMGLRANDINPMIVGLETSLKRMKQLDVATIAKMFGVENFDIVGILKSNSDAFNTMEKSMHSAAITAKGMAAVRMDNMKGDLDQLGAAVDNVRIALAGDLYKDIRAGVQQFTSYLNNNQAQIVSNIKGLLELSVNLGQAYIAYKAIKGVGMVASLIESSSKWLIETSMVRANTVALGQNATARAAVSGAGVAGSAVPTGGGKVRKGAQLATAAAAGAAVGYATAPPEAGVVNTGIRMAADAAILTGLTYGAQKAMPVVTGFVVAKFAAAAPVITKIIAGALTAATGGVAAIAIALYTAISMWDSAATKSGEAFDDAAASADEVSKSASRLVKEASNAKELDEARANIQRKIASLEEKITQVKAKGGKFSADTVKYLQSTISHLNFVLENSEKINKTGQAQIKLVQQQAIEAQRILDVEQERVKTSALIADNLRKQAEAAKEFNNNYQDRKDTAVSGLSESEQIDSAGEQLASAIQELNDIRNKVATGLKEEATAYSNASTKPPTPDTKTEPANTSTPAPPAQPAPLNSEAATVAQPPQNANVAKPEPANSSAPAPTVSAVANVTQAPENASVAKPAPAQPAQTTEKDQPYNPENTPPIANFGARLFRQLFSSEATERYEAKEDKLVKQDDLARAEIDKLPEGKEKEAKDAVRSANLTAGFTELAAFNWGSGAKNFGKDVDLKDSAFDGQRAVEKASRSAEIVAKDAPVGSPLVDKANNAKAGAVAANIALKSAVEADNLPAAIKASQDAARHAQVAAEAQLASAQAVEQVAPPVAANIAQTPQNAQVAKPEPAPVANVTQTQPDAGVGVAQPTTQSTQTSQGAIQAFDDAKKAVQEAKVAVKEANQVKPAKSETAATSPDAAIDAAKKAADYATKSAQAAPSSSVESVNANTAADKATKAAELVSKLSQSPTQDEGAIKNAVQEANVATENANKAAALADQANQLAQSVQGALQSADLAKKAADGIPAASAEAKQVASQAAEAAKAAVQAAQVAAQNKNVPEAAQARQVAAGQAEVATDAGLQVANKQQSDVFKDAEAYENQLTEFGSNYTAANEWLVGMLDYAKSSGNEALQAKLEGDMAAITKIVALSNTNGAKIKAALEKGDQQANSMLPAQQQNQIASADYDKSIEDANKAKKLIEGIFNEQGLTIIDPDKELQNATEIAEYYTRVTDALKSSGKDNLLTKKPIGDVRESMSRAAKGKDQVESTSKKQDTEVTTAYLKYVANPQGAVELTKAAFSKPIPIDFDKDTALEDATQIAAYYKKASAEAEDNGDYNLAVRIEGFRTDLEEAVAKSIAAGGKINKALELRNLQVVTMLPLDQQEASTNKNYQGAVGEANSAKKEVDALLTSEGLTVIDPDKELKNAQDIAAYLFKVQEELKSKGKQNLLARPEVGKLTQSMEKTDTAEKAKEDVTRKQSDRVMLEKEIQSTEAKADGDTGREAQLGIEMRMMQEQESIASRLGLKGEEGQAQARKLAARKVGAELKVDLNEKTKELNPNAGGPRNLGSGGNAMNQLFGRSQNSGLQEAISGQTAYLKKLVDLANVKEQTRYVATLQ